jgi:hypothetical protein
MKLGLLAVTLVVFVSSCSDNNTEVIESPAEEHTYQPAVPGIELIHELVGSWRDVLATDTMQSFEHWVNDDKNVVSGMGYVLAGKDTVQIEDLSITEIDGEYIYNARVRSHNNNEWIQFLLMPSTGDSLRFYNPQHDYPQEIIYVREGDAWNVVISNEAGRSNAFRLERYPEEAG